MEMTDHNMDDENITRDFYNTYHLSAEQADGLEGSHCLQLDLRMRVVQPAPAQYARQGSCVSNAGCESDLCK